MLTANSTKREPLSKVSLLPIQALDKKSKLQRAQEVKTQRKKNAPPKSIDASSRAPGSIAIISTVHRVRRTAGSSQDIKNAFDARRSRSWLALAQPQGMTDLGTMLGLAKSSLTGLVDRTERNGLVQREHESHDSRAVRVSLTPKGAAVTEEFHADASQRIDMLASW